MKTKVSNFTLEMASEICEILNRGNQCEIKKERDNIVIIEIVRHALSKNPIE